MKGKSVVIVLIGSGTAGRKWINYEIKEGWEDGKGVLGVYVHRLKDAQENQSSRGNNPFDPFTLDGVSMASVVSAHDPPYTTSKFVYGHIQDNLGDWIESAISVRDNYTAR